MKSQSRMNNLGPGAYLTLDVMQLDHLCRRENSFGKCKVPRSERKLSNRLGARKSPRLRLYVSIAAAMLCGISQMADVEVFKGMGLAVIPIVDGKTFVMQSGCVASFT